MRCPNCGNEVEEGSVFCPYCRTRLDSARSGSSEPSYRGSAYESGYGRAGVRPDSYGYGAKPMTEEDLPPHLKPMGAWGYFGWGILFAIPFVGFILLIVFSFAGGNVNRKHFARSYWCWLLIAAVIIAILMIVGVWSFGALGSWFQNTFSFL